MKWTVAGSCLCEISATGAAEMAEIPQARRNKMLVVGAILLFGVDVRR